MAHGQGRAAACVAIHAGEHDAGDANRVVERLGRLHRVLAGHRIDDEQGFDRVGGGAYLAHLVHQRLVYGEAAGGVEDNDVEPLAPSRFHRAPGDLHGGLAGDDRQAGDAGAFGELGQLELGGGALRVQAGEQDAALLAPGEPQRQLARGGGLARALQPDHQDRRGRGGREVARHGAGAAQRFDQRIVDDFRDLLAGGDGREHLRADGPFADAGHEILYHRQRHVGVQHGQAHFPQRRRTWVQHPPKGFPPRREHSRRGVTPAHGEAGCPEADRSDAVHPPVADRQG